MKIKKNNGIMIYGKNGAQYLDPGAMIHLFGGFSGASFSLDLDDLIEKKAEDKPWKKKEVTLKEVLERKILDGDGPDAPGA